MRYGETVQSKSGTDNCYCVFVYSFDADIPDPRPHTFLRGVVCPFHAHLTPEDAFAAVQVEEQLRTAVHNEISQHPELQSARSTFLDTSKPVQVMPDGTIKGETFSGWAPGANVHVTYDADRSVVIHHEGDPSPAHQAAIVEAAQRAVSGSGRAEMMSARKVILHTRTGHR